jgi:CHAD domain-containing protein
LHRVRIQAKQVRYAAEAMIPVADAAAQRFADAAADLQDVLGEHQDSINAQRWLQEAGQEKEAFVAGALFVMEGEAAARVRARWGKVWKSVRRRKIRRWMMI